MKKSKAMLKFSRKRLRHLKLPEESESEQRAQSCCVVLCTNTQTNSDLSFHAIPDAEEEPERADRWLKAIRAVNGRWWQKFPQSVVCAEHFVSGAPSLDPGDVDYAPSVFPEDSSAARSRAPQADNSQPRHGASYTAAAHVLGALVAGARAGSSLCSSQLYRRVLRDLRIGVNVGTLHAAWVGAQRAALLQVRAAGRRGDWAGVEPPPFAARLADLVLLHTDVDGHRLLPPASEWCDEEYRALGTLCRLVRRHGAEVGGKPGVKATGRGLRGAELELRWSRVYAGYRATGRTASVIVLQRRWHELKLQAREAGARSHLHRAVARQHPHVLRAPPRAWRQLVLDGDVLKLPRPLPADAALDEPGPGPLPDDSVPDDLPPPGDRPPDEVPPGDPVDDNALPADATTSAQLDNAVKIEFQLESSPPDCIKQEPQDTYEEEATSVEGERVWPSQTGASETEPSTLHLLQSLDPSAMHTEIYYESDDDGDCEPNALDNKVEVKVEPARSVRDFIKFEEDLAESDVTRLAAEDAGGGIDPKLLMDARVQLQRLPLERLVLGSSARPVAGSSSKPAAGSSSKPAAGSSSKPAVGSSSKPAAGSSAKPAAGSSSKPAAGLNSKPAAGSNSDQGVERGWRRVELPVSGGGAGGAGGGRSAPMAAVRPMRVSPPAHPVESDDNAEPASKRRRGEAGCDIPAAPTAPPAATSAPTSTSTSSAADTAAEHRRAARRRLCQLYATFAALLPETVTSIPRSRSDIERPPPSSRAAASTSDRKSKPRHRTNNPPATGLSTPCSNSSRTDTTDPLAAGTSTPESRTCIQLKHKSTPSNDTPECNASTPVSRDSNIIKPERMTTATDTAAATARSKRTNSTISNITETVQSTPVCSTSPLNNNEGMSAPSSSTPGKIEGTPALSTRTPTNGKFTRFNVKSAPPPSRTSVNRVGTPVRRNATLIKSTATVGISVLGPMTPNTAPASIVLDTTPACSTNTVPDTPKTNNSTRRGKPRAGTAPLQSGISVQNTARAPPPGDVTRLAGYDEWQRQKAATAKYFHINTPINVKPPPPPPTTASVTPVPATPKIPDLIPLPTRGSLPTGAPLPTESQLTIRALLPADSPLPTGAPLPASASILPVAPLPTASPLMPGAQRPAMTPLLPETPSAPMTPLQALAPLLAPGQPAPVVVVIQNTINNVYAPAPVPAPAPAPAPNTNTLRHGDCIEISDSD